MATFSREIFADVIGSIDQDVTLHLYRGVLSEDFIRAYAPSFAGPLKIVLDDLITIEEGACQADNIVGDAPRDKHFRVVGHRIGKDIPIVFSYHIGRQW